MPHSLIAGMTASGKSALAKLLIPRWRDRGYRIAILDPLGDKWPIQPGDVQFTNAEQFLLFAKSHQKLALFVDEGAQSLARGFDYNWLTTRARHWGHESHVISQRPQDLTPAVRGNCETCWLFNIDPPAAKLLAMEFNAPPLLSASRNQRLQFHLARRMTETVSVGRIDFSIRSIVITETVQCHDGSCSQSPARSSSPAVRPIKRTSGAKATRRQT